MRRLASLALLAIAVAGCGGGTGVVAPTIQAARVYQLVHFLPAGPITPGKPTTISFTIEQPNGTALTKFKTGPGPHVGVHLIYVRKDLSNIVHHHPPLNGTGKIVDHVVFPSPGPYRLVIDVYPASCPFSSTPALPGAPQPACNFQLFRWLTVSGTYKPLPLPPPVSSETIDGYHFVLTGTNHLVAIQAKLAQVTVTDPDGRPATFTPWYGALAHAIFFREGSLDYFHTHICSKNAVGCTSILGSKAVTGVSTTPGKLNVGMLFADSGTWRLFLQCQVNGHLLTAPFTLRVS